MIKRIALRMIRSALSSAIAGWWAAKQSDPRYIFLAPAIQGAGKFLREKFPRLSGFIPF